MRTRPQRTCRVGDSGGNREDDPSASALEVVLLTAQVVQSITESAWRYKPTRDIPCQMPPLSDAVTVARGGSVPGCTDSPGAALGSASAVREERRASGAAPCCGFADRPGAFAG